MNLRALMNHKKLNKNLVFVLLLTFLPAGFGPLQNANAAKASNLTANSLEASCASTASDTSSAKLDVIIDGNYCVLRFLSSTNTWTPPNGGERFDYLVVGGGGGGGGERAGGGGAGGVVLGNLETTSALSISVGSGGNGGTPDSSANKTGKDGTESTLGSIARAYGGGGGSGSFSCCGGQAGRDGGSGGGAGIWNDTGIDWKGTTNTNYPGGSPLVVGQGNRGGGSGPTFGLLPTTNTCNYSFDTIRNAGGGGGAGGPGLSGQGGTRTGYGSSACDLATNSGVTQQKPNGGNGIQSSITGAPIYYAGGGGGSGFTVETQYFTAGAGTGGLGGGGAGASAINTTANSGTPNTGGGGGGGAAGGSGGSGGSGVVIVRFLAPNFHNDLLTQICPSGITSVNTDSHTSSLIAGDCVLTFGTPSEASGGSYTWRVPTGVTSAQILIVGGGGGGGNVVGGGGGGGQVIDSSTVPVLLNAGETYTLTVGIGGNHQAGYTRGSYNGGTNGQSSSVAGTGVSLTALGGGGAAGDNTALDKVSNLSGWTRGGCGYFNSSSYSCKGNPVGGATRTGGEGSTIASGSGGGGDSGPGGDAALSSTGGGYSYANYGGGVGGAGTSSRIAGYLLCFGGGGSGGSPYDTGQSGQNWRPLATCGGGTGARGPLSNGSQVTNALAGTGGGGGGAGVYTDSAGTLNAAPAAEGGRGGSGLIIIRFTVPNPRGATNNLNLACHAFSGTTTIEQSISSGYFGSPFTTDTTTSEFTFEPNLSIGQTDRLAHDWGSGSPAGCSSGDYFTVYVWGYLQNPTAISQDIYFSEYGDDNVRLQIDGKVLINQASTGTPGSSFTYSSTPVNMPANSWHFVQLWVHELSNNASVKIFYNPGSLPSSPNSYSNWQDIYKTKLSRYVPRTLNSSVIPTSTRYNETLTVSMTVDTSSVVVGGVNDSATTMSNRGKFTFYDSQTALTGCTNVYSADGAFKCSWYVKPTALGVRTIKIVFTPDSSTAMTDLQYNVFRRVEWTQAIEVTKGRQSPLRIGQYAAFVGISSYPLNVYPDTSIYPKMGTTYTRSVTTGTAGCQLDPTRFFVTDTLADTSSGGSCVATVVLSGTELFAPETGTATIYFVKWSDAYATQVPSGAHTIPLSGGTQIIVHTETVTVTDTATTFRDLSNNVITSAAPGAEIRIYITGYAGLSASDLTVTFRVYEDATITAKTDTYVQVLVPTTASSGVVAIDSPRGVSYTPSLTISP